MGHNIKPRRTVEGFVTPTSELVTSLKQLNEGDVVMLGYKVWPSFLPYRVFKINGEPCLGIISAFSRHPFGQSVIGLTEECFKNVIMYKAEIDTSDKTRTELLYLGSVLTIGSFISLKVMDNPVISMVGILLAIICAALSKMPSLWGK